MRLGLEHSGAAVVLQHDLVLLLHLFAKQTHEISLYPLCGTSEDNGEAVWAVDYLTVREHRSTVGT